MNIRIYTIDDMNCLGYEKDGKIYVMSWLGKRGDCVDTTGKAYACYHHLPQIIYRNG